MTLTELINAVYVETNRPDLVAETTQAVQGSTLKMHNLEFFPRDIVEGEVVFTTAAYYQQLSTSQFARFRALKYLRKYDPTLANYSTTLPPLAYPAYDYLQALAFLDLIEPDDILDEFGVERVDVAYLAGTSINIKSSTSVQYLLAGWYAYPNVDSSSGGVNFSSWVATDYPYAIIYDAAGKLLSSIGNLEAARKYIDPRGGLVAEQVQMLLMNNLLGKGY